MSLLQLALSRPQAGPLAVPAWTLGCFRRRCITFASGLEDTTTRVIWIQSHGLTADLRLPLIRPDVRAAGSLEHCTDEQRAEIARGEGFIARTSWDGALMRWDAFAAFHPYDRWPEPGRLERVGNCLIEWAPSGVYVEDWRFQPGASGLLVGLELLSETGPDGRSAQRSGGLVISGDHALLVLGRRQSLPEGRAHELLSSDPGLWRTAFDCQVAYARRDDSGWPVSLAVDPFMEGCALFHDSAFRPGPSADLLIQANPSREGDWTERLWRIDTLLPGYPGPLSTEATPAGLDWLSRESDALGLSGRSQ